VQPGGVEKATACLEMLAKHTGIQSKLSLRNFKKYVPNISWFTIKAYWMTTYLSGTTPTVFGCSTQEEWHCNYPDKQYCQKKIAFCTDKRHFPFSTPASSDLMETFVSVFWYGDEEMGDPLQLLPGDIVIPMWLCIALSSPLIRNGTPPFESVSRIRGEPMVPCRYLIFG
jgi:hypothetical protein